MKTVLKAVIAALIIPGGGLYAQDFTGQGFRDALENARQELAAPRAAAPAPVAVDFPADDSGAAAVKEWTVMVFLNGKNNLEGDGLADLNEMEQVGSTPGVNVVVEIGQQSNNRLARVLVSRDTDTVNIASRVLSTASAVDMGDPASVKDFVLWAERRFPAKKFMLILWDHGSGWIKGNPVEERRGSGKGISDDFVTGHNIDTPQLGRLFRDIEAAGGRVDLLATDACLMQMAEVSYELKDSKIAYLAASEEIEPGDGYPYDKWLAPLALKPSMGPRELGVTVAKEYLKANPNGFQGRGLTYSVIQLSKIKELGEKMDALAKAAMDSGDKAAVLKARAEATRYKKADNKDLRRFAQLLGKYSKDQAVKEAAAAVDKLIAKGGPVVFSGVSKNKRTRSYGVAVYMPEDGGEIRGYDELKLAADTRWDEFVGWLLKP